MNREYSGEEDRRAEWVIEGILARAHRPGYPANRPDVDKIRQWADAALEMGVRSIISVIDDAQVSYYDSLDLDGGGLFGYYRSLGLTVEHISADDYKTPPLSPEQLEDVWQSFQSLDKPVLIHCSAGRDRTGASVEHILSRLESHDS